MVGRGSRGSGATPPTPASGQAKRLRGTSAAAFVAFVIRLRIAVMLPFNGARRVFVARDG